jgi:predicted Zn-dependent protease
MYASYLLQLNRSKEAQVILNRLTFEQYEPVNVALLMSLAYEAD